MFFPYDDLVFPSQNLGADHNACGVHNYIQCADPSPIDGLRSTSLPFGVTGLPGGHFIPMSSYGSGHHGEISTGLPPAYEASPLLCPPKVEHRASVDVDAEWKAMLERIPTHNPANNTSSQQPTLPATRGFPDTAVVPNERSLCISLGEPFHDLIVVNPSLPPPCIRDPLATERVENTPLAPMSMSPLQNGPGRGDEIGTIGVSLRNLSTEIPENHQNYHPLLGTLLHSREYCVS